MIEQIISDNNCDVRCNCQVFDIRSIYIYKHCEVVFAVLLSVNILKTILIFVFSYNYFLYLFFFLYKS